LKKVAYIFTPIEFGGSERVNLLFLKNVDRTQFEINPILLIRPWEQENIFIRKLEEDKYTINTIPVALRKLNEGRDYFRVVRCVLYVYRILSNAHFDLVHTHGYFADIIAAPVCKILSIPQMATCHGFISNDNNLKVYNKIDKLMLRLCSRIITVSTEIKNDLVKGGIDQSKIIVIQNAIQSFLGKKEIDNSRIGKRRDLSVRENEFTIGYLGRLSEEKGVNYLIEAGYILKEKGEDFKIIIIGDGPKRKELEDLTRSKGLKQQVVFTGFQNDIEEWLSAMDCLVLPSLTEGTPMAILEAMSLGVPIIASAVGGIPSVVENGVNGLLVAPGDYRELSEKILLIIKNKTLRFEMAMKGVNIIKKRFDVHEWCHKIESQYDSVLENTKHYD
jgi:glycosyltransferase involved in cell wall biosynthesis